MSPTDIKQKFTENAILAMPEQQADQIIDLVERLDELTSIRELVSACVVES